MRRLILILIVLTLGVTVSLWDVDKNSNNRISPQLNQSDQILQRVSNATTSVNPVTDATTTSGFLKTANGQILGNNGTNNVGLFGFDDTGTMVVKVAKPGYDANSATNDQLIFNSAQNVFKIVDVVPMTVTVNTTSGSVVTYYGSTSEPHGLTYIPSIQAYIQVPVSISGSNPAVRFANPAMVYGTVASKIDLLVVADVEVDATNVYLSVQMSPSLPTGSYTFTANVHLLQETFN